MHSSEIEIKVSRIFIGLLALAAFGSLFIILFLKIGLFLKPLLFFSVLFYSGYIFWAEGLQRGENVIKKIRLLKNGECELYFKKSSEKIRVKISGDSTVTRVVCALLFCVQGRRFRRYRCVVWRDSVGGGDYRALLVWLHGESC